MDVTVPQNHQTERLQPGEILDKEERGARHGLEVQDERLYHNTARTVYSTVT